MADTGAKGKSLGQTTTKGPASEDADYEELVQKMASQDFNDWPNVAGFEGLTEVRGPVKLTVKGHIPSWAAGSLYRTGPGEFEIDDTPVGKYRVTHWFDGFGQSHRFDIVPDGSNPDAPATVTYTSRRQTQELVGEIRKRGGMKGFSFGQRRDPCVGLFSKMMTVWRMPMPDRNTNTDNTSVTVQTNLPGLPTHQREQTADMGHRPSINSVWLTTDTNGYKEMDRDTLQPLGFAKQADLHPLLKGPLSCAHVQRDPRTGDIFNYNLAMGMQATYHVFRVNAADGTTDILATICQSDVPPAYIHSFFLTPSFVVLCVPSTHLGARGLRVLWERNIAEAIEPFDETKRCKWFFIDRKGDGGIVATHETPAGFFFHSVNAFEVEEEDTAATPEQTVVMCDVIEYPTADVIRSFEVDVLTNRNGMSHNFWGSEARNRNTHARLVRHKFRVPRTKPTTSKKRKTNQASKPLPLPKPEQVLRIKAPHVGELPTINPAYAMRPYRYVYTLPNRGHSTLLDSLAKTDLKTRETTYWANARGHTPGEAIFVARPGRTSDENGEERERDEDDGVLLSVVLDGFGRTSYLVCIDARTMQELGRAECEWAIAFGFHGVHAPSA